MIKLKTKPIPVLSLVKTVSWVKPAAGKEGCVLSSWTDESGNILYEVDWGNGEIGRSVLSTTIKLKKKSGDHLQLLDILGQKTMVSAESLASMEPHPIMKEILTNMDGDIPAQIVAILPDCGVGSYNEHLACADDFRVSLRFYEHGDVCIRGFKIFRDPIPPLPLVEAERVSF